jgi:SAM-dependent methyltransferase
VGSTAFKGHDHYVLPRTDDEAQRLHEQARLLQPWTRELLLRAGLTPGWQCLDVGCGAGDGARLMGELAGPTGSVTGLDVDRRLGEETFARLQASGTCRFEFVHDNLADGQVLGARRFDLVFTRLVLIHQRDPLAALARVWRWVGPAGVLLAMDFDLGQGGSWPPFAPADELRRLACRTLECTGCDPRIGIKLPYLLREATRHAPEDVAIFGTLAPLAQRKELMLHSYRNFVPRALELGLTTPDVVERTEKAWLQACGDECYVQSPTLVGAWVRRRERSGGAS